MQTLPLTNTLGYEFSALMGLIFFIAGGILFLKEKEGINFFHYIKDNYLWLLLIVLVPFIISFINSVFINICPFGNGILFYFFISVVSLILGIQAGHLARIISFRHYYLQFFLLIAGFTIVSLLEIYFYPQVFTFNPVIGFYPGTVYDELIEFTGKIFFFRVYNMLFFAASIFLIGKLKNSDSLNKFWNLIKKNRLAQFSSSFLITLIFFLIYWIINLTTGFAYPVKAIENALGGRLETDHFIIIYPKSIPRDMVANSAMHHEFYYNEIKRDLNVAPAGKITSILFADDSQKKQYTGTANADISKPWQNCVISDFSNYDRTLKHEIVHAFSARFGGRIFKVAYGFNPLLIEGMAVAIENQFDDNNLYYSAFMIRHFNKNLSIARLFKGFNFFGQASSVSYVYSGAFIKYLIDRFGVEKAEELYTNPDFEHIYGRNLQSLQSDFEGYIDSLPFVYNQYKAKLYFAGKPIFLKKCPRYVAYEMKKGNEYFADRDYGNALKTFRAVYKDAETAPALTGVISSLIKLSRGGEALEVLKNEIGKFENSNTIYYLLLQLADLYVRTGSPDKADSVFKQIINENPYSDYVFNAEMKEVLLGDGYNVLKKYIEGNGADRREIILQCANLENIYRLYWMIQFAKPSDPAINELFGKLGVVAVRNELELHIFYKISQFLKDRGNFAEAVKFARMCLEYKEISNGFSTILEENLQKTNYLLNFGEQIRKNIHFADDRTN